MKSVLIVMTAALMANAGGAWAQDRPAEASSERETRARRQQIQMMEGVLTTAVKNGAATLAQRMQIAEPGSLIVTGSAGARGFLLEGYGVFFDVDVPAMRQSVVWSTRMMLDQRKEDLRRLIAGTPDGPDRRRFIAQLQVIEPSYRPDTVPAAAPSRVSQSASGMVTAQTVPEPVVEPDPNDQYTEAVKTALMDAMLDYSGLNLGADEWLTVAARDSEGPLLPGALEDKSTIVLRVKGRDLIAYQARQITREEARKRVEVKEF